MAAQDQARAIAIANRLTKTQFPARTDYVDKVLERGEVQWLLDRATGILLAEPTLLEIQPPVNICGDTHGQFNDVVRLFRHAGWPPERRYLFLGDYVDRGPNSVEVICLVLACKVAFKNDFFILRGNHESSSINRVYGFWDELCGRYDKSLWASFNACFNCLPVAALIGHEIFCMHGGISPSLSSFDDIRCLQKPMTVADEGLVCDLLWADPDSNVIGWKKEYARRIVPVWIEFCERLGISMVIRAHQVVPADFEFFADCHVVTVFSAPNYCDQFDNHAGVFIVEPNFRCRIKVVQAKKKIAKRQQADIVTSSN